MKSGGEAFGVADVGATSTSHSEGIATGWLLCSSSAATSVWPSVSEGISRSDTGTRLLSGSPYRLERRGRLRSRASAICSSRPKTTPARLPTATTRTGAGSGTGVMGEGTDAAFAVSDGRTGGSATTGNAGAVTAGSGMVTGSR